MSALPPGWGANQRPLGETKLPLATQIFPAASMMDADLRATLKSIKAAGYDGVEFFGGLKFAAQDVRRALDDADLQIVGWHTPWDYLSPDFIHTTITYNKVLGNQYLVVPWRADEVLHTTESCLQFAKELTWVSEILGRYDMVTGYHNHGTEFRPTDDTGELPWDIIAQNTPSNVIMQNDIGNGMAGGGDMMALLKKYPGRGATVHMKPFAEGNASTFFDAPNCIIDWDEYFKVCRDIAGVRWYIVEYLNEELYPGDPIGGMKASAEWFRKRGGK